MKVEVKKILLSLCLSLSFISLFNLPILANDPQTGTTTEHYEVRWDKPQITQHSGYINVLSQNITTNEKYVDTFYWNITPYDDDYYVSELPSYMNIKVTDETITFTAEKGNKYDDPFMLTLVRYHGRGLTVLKSKSDCAGTENTFFIYNDGLDVDRKILGYYVYGNIGIIDDQLGKQKDNNFTVTYGVTADSNPYNLYVAMLEKMQNLDILQEIDIKLETLEEIASLYIDMKLSDMVDAFDKSLNQTFKNSLFNKLDEIFNDPTKNKIQHDLNQDEFDSTLRDLYNNEQMVGNFMTQIDDEMSVMMDSLNRNENILNGLPFVSNIIDDAIMNNDYMYVIYIFPLIIGFILTLIGIKLRR